MSISQMFRLCFNGDSGVFQQHKSIAGIRPQQSPQDKCETALANLSRVADEHLRIQSDTATASKLLQASSEAVVQCLTCPNAADKSERKDLP